MSNSIALSCEHVSKSFGGVRALGDISITAETGKVVGVIGPNGSGKSTLINVISGFYRADKGAVRLGDSDITSLRPARIRRLGLVRTFQNLRVYPEMSVLDNLLVGMHLEFVPNDTAVRPWLASVTGLGRPGRKERAVQNEGRELLPPDLRTLADSSAGDLPYGRQKRLELIRAVAVPPRVVLLDEPTAGLDSNEAHDVMGDFLERANSLGVESIILIEHRLDLVRALCDIVYVLAQGEVLASGPPDVVTANKDVIEVYVGKSSTTEPRFGQVLNGDS